MKLSKSQRAALRNKFGGLCAYCGAPLGDRWHADHIEPVERKLEFVREGYSTRMRATGDVHRPERDCFENLNPACAPCNIDKHAMSLEGWRQKLQNAPGVLSRNQPTYRHAIRFGLVQETGSTIAFYFERAPTPSPVHQGEVK
jgi:hypothetical protein